MDATVIVFLVVGIILCLIEIFTPGFGVFGICGMLSLAVGIIIRMVNGGSVSQLIILITIIILILILSLFIMIWSSKSGLISYTPLILKETVLPRDYNKPNLIYGDLIGKIGITITDCRPVGKVLINDIEYEVISTRGFLIKGVEVEVSEVEGTKILVKPL